MTNGAQRRWPRGLLDEAAEFASPTPLLEAAPHDRGKAPTMRDASLSGSDAYPPANAGHRLPPALVQRILLRGAEQALQ